MIINRVFGNLRLCLVLICASTSFLSMNAESDNGLRDAVVIEKFNLVPTRLIYLNLCPEVRESIDRLSDKDRQFALEIMAINIEMWNYIEADENNKVRLMLSRDEAIARGMTNAHYDRVLKSVDKMNAPVVFSTGETLPGGLSQEYIEKTRLEMKEYKNDLLDLEE